MSALFGFNISKAVATAVDLSQTEHIQEHRKLWVCSHRSHLWPKHNGEPLWVLVFQLWGLYAAILQQLRDNTWRGT